MRLRLPGNTRRRWPSLRRAWDEREPVFILHARHFPEFRNLHWDPRFAEILREMDEPVASPGQATPGVPS